MFNTSMDLGVNMSHAIPSTSRHCTCNLSFQRRAPRRVVRMAAAIEIPTTYSKVCLAANFAVGACPRANRCF